MVECMFVNTKKCKFDRPFLSFKPKHNFIGKSKVYDMTEFSGAVDKSSDFEYSFTRS